MLLCAGCDEVPGDLPSIKPVSKLPVFTTQENEIEIADSFKGSDPTMVLGAIVERKSGLVRSLDSVLKDDAKTVLKPVSELVFKDFLENSAVADAEWLDFLKGQVNDTRRAEVTVTEISTATIDISSIDKDKLQKFAQRIDLNSREDYGVVIGYRDFVVSASFFTEQTIEGKLSGYGAKIGGKWFGKHEGVSADHRIVAVWAPLPFTLERIVDHGDTARKMPFVTITHRALRDGNIQIRPLDRRKPFRLQTPP